jgi:hypothetical protein
MDRSAILWAARLGVAGSGLVLMFGAVRLLGRARAAANWPTATPVSALARPLGWSGLAAGLGGLAVAAALSLSTLAAPALVPSTPRAWLLAAIGALVVLLAGLGAAGRLVERAELSVLIRTRGGEARAPAEQGEPGWVYQDAAGDWYLAVSSRNRQRLVRLTDFTLVPDGTARPPLTLQGSVEISVYPVALR